MRAIIDGLEKRLKDHPLLSGINIEAYGSEIIIPEHLPYINILPNSKDMERQFLIGGGKVLYNASPELRLLVWTSSMNSLRQAFYDNEELINKLIVALSESGTRTEMNVDYSFVKIDSYDSEEYDSSFYYVTTLLLTVKVDETYLI